MVWCCGLFFNERDFKILLEAKAVHIHTGDENPFVKNPPKSIWQEREEQAMEYFRKLFADVQDVQ